MIDVTALSPAALAQKPYQELMTRSLLFSGLGTPLNQTTAQGCESCVESIAAAGVFSKAVFTFGQQPRHRDDNLTEDRRGRGGYPGNSEYCNDC